MSTCKNESLIFANFWLICELLDRHWPGPTRIDADNVTIKNCQKRNKNQC